MSSRRYRSQIFPGLERPWEAGIVFEFVLESVNCRLISRTPECPGILCNCLQCTAGRPRLAPLQTALQWARGWGLLSLGVSPCGLGELLTYQDGICFLPRHPISHLFTNLFLYLTFIFSLWLLRLCLKTRGCLLIIILWVFEGGSWEGETVMFCGLFVVQKEVLRCRKSHTTQTFK